MRRTAYIILLTVCTLTSCGHDGVVPGSIRFTAPIYPDYMDVTVPVNIAPLNFSYVCPPGETPVTTFRCGEESVSIRGRDVRWSPRRWKRMLETAAGGDITVTSSVTDTVWKITVSRDSIDYGLTYRLIEPGYSLYSRMGIHERCLENFNEHPLIENTRFGGCVNCHCFNRCSPSDMSLHIRGAHGATLLRVDGEMQAYDTRTGLNQGFCVYPYWHPSGEYMAYSSNQTVQNFHLWGTKPVEVFDKSSHVYVYSVAHNRLFTTPALQRDTLLDTFPAFSPDGHTLWFCRASSFSTMKEVRSVRYNLCRIAFDPATGMLADTVETVLEAASARKSISFPRPSSDGRFLVFTMSDYGQFSIWHPEADLWMMDLTTLEAHPLDGINSADTESYHSFSSSGRWMVFSSRRDDGLFTRVWFTHISPDGTASKPFMLPQRNPLRHYSENFLSYNVPEFVSSSVCFDAVGADKLIESDIRVKFNQ